MKPPEMRMPEMNDAERLSEYLHSLDPCDDEYLENLREYAKVNDVPIVRRETEHFLKTIINIKKPENILEIGTAIGYSSIVMAKACDADIVTIENYEKRIPIALDNIRAAGFENRIDLRQNDAGAELKNLVGEGRSFDLVFLDAAKGQYLIWLPDIISLMRKDSVLIADNVLQERTVMESRFTIPRRERTTHERMREFLYLLMHDPALESSVLNVGDGVSLSVLKQ